VKVRRHSRPRARIEIIPMIDTVFFLLVFFMMASLAMTVYRGLPITLPQAASGQRVPDTATVTVSGDGRLWLDRNEVTLAELRARLEAGVRENAALTAIINADSAARHGLVVEVMDGARMAGVSSLAIAVRPKESR
jgi:biopolymer transport protein ExbD